MLQSEIAARPAHDRTRCRQLKHFRTHWVVSAVQIDARAQGASRKRCRNARRNGRDYLIWPLTACEHASNRAPGFRTFPWPQHAAAPRGCPLRNVYRKPCNAPQGVVQRACGPSSKASRVIQGRAAVACVR
jgi:hypothetical protein